MKTIALLVTILLAGSAWGETFKILVFSKTAGFRHATIANGITLIGELAAAHGFAADCSEDASVFTDSNLAQYEAVIFLSTTGDILDVSQQTAFEHFIQAGGGWAGVHAAADTEYDWA